MVTVGVGPAVVEAVIVSEVKVGCVRLAVVVAVEVGVTVSDVSVGCVKVAVVEPCVVDAVTVVLVSCEGVGFKFRT